MKQINIVVTVSLVLLLAFGASAQIDIKAADGTNLSGSTYIGDTFTVQIVDGGASVGQGTNVVFVPGNPRANPIYAATDEDGKAKCKPRVNGIWTIRVLDGTTVVAKTEITVEGEPWVPEPTATKIPYSGGGGGGGVPLPDPTPTPTIVPTAVDDVPVPVDTPVIPVVDQEVIDSKLDSPKPKATPAESSIPGFGVVFAIAGILGGAYVYYRRMR